MESTYATKEVNAMINFYLLSAFSKEFTKETFLFLKYFTVYEQKYQKARLLSRNKTFNEIPEQIKASILPGLRCCSARLFEMNRICSLNYGVPLINGSPEQETYTPLELHEIVNIAFKTLASSSGKEQKYA